MYPLKQSAALTVPFFVHDVSGDAVTGLTDGSFTKRISKNGGAFAAMTVTITELENGWYSIPLSATHSDTLGILSITFTNAGAKQANLQYRVHVRIPDDLAFPATSGRSIQVETDGHVHADVKEWLGVAPLALVAQRVNVSVGAMAANVLTATAINAAAFTAAKFAAGAFDAVWTVATRVLTAATNITSTGGTTFTQTGDSFLRLGAPVDASISADVANVQGDTNNIQTRLPAVLVGSRMDSSVGAMAANVLTASAIAAAAITAAKFAAGAIDSAAIALSGAQFIADEHLKRDMSAISGEAARSPLNAIRKLMNKWDIVGTVLTVRKEDDIAIAYTQAITVDATADPIVSLDTA